MLVFKDYAIGKWTGSEFYENDELSDMNDLFKTFTMEMNEDGTGKSITPFGSQPMYWSYNESKEELRIETVTTVKEDTHSVYYDSIAYIEKDIVVIVLDRDTFISKVFEIDILTINRDIIVRDTIDGDTIVAKVTKIDDANLWFEYQDQREVEQRWKKSVL